MSFQAVRNVIEQAVSDGFKPVTPAITTFVVDNMEYAENIATTEYVACRIDFGPSAENTLIGVYERLRGSFVVEFFTQKNTGPGRSQEVMALIMKSINDLNSCTTKPSSGAHVHITDMVGPNFFALKDRPYFYARISCGFTATYDEVILEPPSGTPPPVLH